MTNDRDVAYYHKRHLEDGKEYSPFCRDCKSTHQISDRDWVRVLRSPQLIDYSDPSKPFGEYREAVEDDFCDCELALKGHLRRATCP